MLCCVHIFVGPSASSYTNVYIHIFDSVKIKLVVDVQWEGSRNRAIRLLCVAVSFCPRVGLALECTTGVIHCNS